MRGGHRPGFDRFFMFLPGFAEMHMHIHKPGKYVKAFRVDRKIRSRTFPDRKDSLYILTICDNVKDTVRACGRVDDMAAPDPDFLHIYSFLRLL